MIREKIAPGVYLTRLNADKFNRQRIALHFQFPNQRSTATAAAILPLVLERGWEGCPDMTQLSRELAKLYGAALGVDNTLSGGNRILTVDISGLKNDFALNGEDLSREYARIALGVAFQPYLVDGAFDDDAVAIEGQKLTQRLETEINDKRLYCIRQARRQFYAGSPAGVERDGYLEEIASVDGKLLKAVYDEIIRTATIDVMVQGADVDAVKTQLLQHLEKIDRQPAPLAERIAMPIQETAHYTESFDMVQAKLCMLFTAGDTDALKNLNAARLAMALFGGSVTSRLFLRVREQQSLCYYCSSSCNSMSGAMLVDSGIAPENAANAEAAILKELAELQNGEITSEEVEDCRRGLLSGMQSIGDSMEGEENWYYMQICRGEEPVSPEEGQRQLKEVTVEDARQILRSFHYSVGYLLTTKEVV